jgi:hypothetical protein
VQRIDPPVNCRTTDHSTEIANLRDIALGLRNAHLGTARPVALMGLTYSVAADLLQAHDDTGISLDNWDSARGLVETLLDQRILENGV